MAQGGPESREYQDQKDEAVKSVVDSINALNRHINNYDQDDAGIDYAADESADDQQTYAKMREFADALKANMSKLTAEELNSLATKLADLVGEDDRDDIHDALDGLTKDAGGSTTGQTVSQLHGRQSELDRWTHYGENR